MRPEEVWFGDSLPARLARIALLPAAGLYGLGFAAYRAVYDLGLKRPYRAPIPVVCVGNLAVGGSGKTPTVLHLYDVLTGLGKEVVVSASGYGSPRSEGATIAPDGPLDPREWGDEPAMMRWLRPEMPLVVGRRRPLAARLVTEARPDAVLLMDDGFQHLPLAKTLTILLDPERPDNALPLPAGPYREFRSGRRRADLVLSKPEGYDPDAVIQGGGFLVAEQHAQKTLAGAEFRLTYDAPEIQSPEGEAVSGGDAALLTAIARPERFVATALAAMGPTFLPSVVRRLPDHDPLDAPDLFDPFPSGGLILTTAKDWIKLGLRSDAGRFRWGIVRREASIYPREPFAAWLRERIGQE